MRLPIDRRLRAWLDGGGSLSRRIAAAFSGFRVERLSQRCGPATREEWRALGMRGARRVHVREVVLWGDGQPLVLARSVLPAVQAGLAWRAVRGLGVRPLADLLFGTRSVARQPLGLVRQSPLRARGQRRRHGPALAVTAWPLGGAWGRRARFLHRGVPLLLTEWFSPRIAGRAPAGLPRHRGVAAAMSRVRGRG